MRGLEPLCGTAVLPLVGLYRPPLGLANISDLALPMATATTSICGRRASSFSRCPPIRCFELSLARRGLFFPVPDVRLCAGRGQRQVRGVRAHERQLRCYPARWRARERQGGLLSLGVLHRPQGGAAPTTRAQLCAWDECIVFPFNTLV